MAGSPPEVEQFSDAMVRAASEALGLTLDFTPETLPFLDHYRDHYIRSVGASDTDGDLIRPEFLQLVAPMAACYFGEVVRRSHQTRWVTPTDNPPDWRMEFVDCFMYFNPMGVAVESFLGYQSDAVPGSIQVSRTQRPGVQKVLDNQPPIRPEDFFRFTVRWETLDLISFHLLQDKTLKGDQDRTFSEADYLRHIDTEE